MVEYSHARFSVNRTNGDRLVSRKGRLGMDLPIASFATAFASFTRDAEAFALTLTDTFHRKFAFRYLTYLQAVAQGTDPVKPNVIGAKPACRLICAEMERQFRHYFYRPDQSAATSPRSARPANAPKPAAPEISTDAEEWPAAS